MMKPRLLLASVLAFAASALMSVAAAAPPDLQAFTVRGVAAQASPVADVHQAAQKAGTSASAVVGVADVNPISLAPARGPVLRAMAGCVEQMAGGDMGKGKRPPRCIEQVPRST